MFCERCNKEFFEDWRIDRGQRKKPLRFCSRKCSNKRYHTKETKQKISKKLKKIEDKFCIKCNKKINKTKKENTCKWCRPRLCARCKIPLNSNNTFYREKSRDKLSSFCKKCFSIMHKEKISNRKKENVKIKGGKCIRCGYDKCLQALEFHHLIPEEKEFNYSEYRDFNKEKLLKELDKCILLCSNCHREEHYKQD